MTGLDGTFSRSDVPEEMVNHSRDFQVPLDCTWVITVAETHKVCYYLTACSLIFIFAYFIHDFKIDSIEFPELRTDGAQRV